MNFGSIRVCVEWVILASLVIYTSVCVNFVVGVLVLVVAAFPYLFLGAFESEGATPGRKECGKRVFFYLFALFVEVCAEYISKLPGVMSQDAVRVSEHRNNSCRTIEGESEKCAVQHGKIEDITDTVIESVIGFNSPFGFEVSALQYCVMVTVFSYLITILLVFCVSFCGCYIARKK